MEMAKEILVLVSMGIGILSTGIPLIISLIKLFKNKNAQQIITIIMSMADAAMIEAEKSGLKGADKKQLVINSVKAACLAQNIEVDNYIEQLVAYIDDCVNFANKMNK